MYIWIAIDVNEQVRELRECAEAYTKSHGLSSPTLTLPYHISLKISCQIPKERWQEAVSDIRDLCKSLKPFSIPVRKVEKTDTIIWLTMQDNSELTYIHNKLDELILEKYGIAQHEFDKAFIFHTSILILQNQEQVCHAFEAIKDANIPDVLQAEKVIIGSSEDGQAGTYIVNEKIML